MERDCKPKLYVVVGPTASGKSSYAIELAKKHDGEIVNGDSRQLYKEVSIGVAKPEFDRVEDCVGYEDGIAHHLYFELDPIERASVVAYQKRAFEVIDDIIARGKTPILVGGTGYYVQAVVDNMQYPEVDTSQEVARCEKMNLDEMLVELKDLDVKTYERIDRANPRRVQNALVRARLGLDDVVAGSLKYDVVMYGIDVEMDLLEQRIVQRVDQMFEMGLVEEVKRIVDRYGFDVPVLNSIGYAEVVLLLKGEKSLDEVKQLICVHTRQYAKRQKQWFRGDSRIQWLNLV